MIRVDDDIVLLLDLPDPQTSPQRSLTTFAKAMAVVEGGRRPVLGFGHCFATKVGLVLELDKTRKNHFQFLQIICSKVKIICSKVQIIFFTRDNCPI